MEKRVVLSFILGVLVGIVAGMVGVGGGEFRIPALTYLLKGSMASVATSNLLIGFFTVVVSFFLRLSVGLAEDETVLHGVYLSIGSVFGAYLGALMTGKFSDRMLRLMVVVYLLTVGLRFTFEPLIGEIHENLLFEKNMFPLYLIGFGFLVGVVSTMFGIAGGEIRIPILIMFFGLGVKQAGTASLFASIATVGVGFLKHFRMGCFKAEFTWVTLSMAVGSILGAFIGTFLALFIHEEYLKPILGLVLITATVRFMIRFK